MTNLVTYSDFAGQILLVLNPGQEERLTAYISRYQKEALEMLLGLNLYAEFDTGISETTPDAKWTKLRDGEATYYSYSGYKRKYTGLKTMVAYYVYFKWVTNETTSQTNQGETKDLALNGESVFNVSRAVEVYNYFLELYKEAQNYIEYQNSKNGVDYYAGYDTAYLRISNSFGV